MFWLSSSGFSGYARGKYSLAFPTGVGFIGLLFLVIGIIITLRFPNIVTDWTKVEFCIVKETNKGYKNWVYDLDRDVTILMEIRNLTDLESTLPQFDWTGPFEFIEQSEETKVQFLPDYRVTFKKDINFNPNTDLTDIPMTIPNLWLFREYSTLTDPPGWIYRTLPRLMIDTASAWIGDHWANPHQLLEFWSNISISDSGQSGRIGSFQKSIQHSNISGHQQVWTKLISSILIDLIEHGLNGTGKWMSDTTACLKNAEEEKVSKFTCPPCFAEQSALDFLLVTFDYLHRYPITSGVWANLKWCYSGQWNGSMTDQQFYTIQQAISNYFFDYIRRALLLDHVDRNGIFQSSNAGRAGHAKGNGLELGILPAIFGANADHSYDWRTCAVGWDIDAERNFEWRALDSHLVEWNAKSEYFISLPSRIEPCLRPTRAHRMAVMLDGLWRPAMFTYTDTGEINGETVYTYDLTWRMLPYDGLFPNNDFTVNVTNAIGLHAYVSPILTNQSDPVARIQVEPVTGAIWRVILNFELSIVVADDILTAANMSHMIGQRIPLARIYRQSRVTSESANFLKQQLKPMLAVICGGVVVSALLAIIFVGLALSLIIKLHCKPFWERTQVQPEPQDLQLLNTVKLRKLMGT